MCIRDRALTVAISAVAKIRPAMTLAEVADLRQVLSKLKPRIAEKRETLGSLSEEYVLNRESQLGAPLREIILLLEDLEKNRIPAMENAIGETDFESIGSLQHDIEQLQIAVLRAKETIRGRLGTGRM